MIKIKSLPFDATQLDMIQFFDGFKLKPNGVQLVVRSDNKPTGEVRAALVLVLLLLLLPFKHLMRCGRA